MATGYTHAVSEGENTNFNDFVWTCARAMGAFGHQRDDSLNAKLHYGEGFSTYYRDQVEPAKERLAEAKARTFAQWAKLMESERSDRVTYDQKYIEKQNEKTAHLTKMLEQVRAWIPPTPEHEGLKKFMIEQLVETINFDCSGLDKPAPTPTKKRVPPDTEALAKYIANEIRYRANEVERVIAKANEEEDRERKRKEWIDALRASVPVPKHKDGFKK